VKRELVEALSAIQARFAYEEGHAPSSCPCAVADDLGSTRIVKVLAQGAGLCRHPKGDGAKT
jgi:hypothetical protein